MRYRPIGLGIEVEAGIARYKSEVPYLDWTIKLRLGRYTYYLARQIDHREKPSGIRLNRRVPAYITTFRIPRK